MKVRKKEQILDLHGLHDPAVIARKVNCTREYVYVIFKQCGLDPKFNQEKRIKVMTRNILEEKIAHAKKRMDAWTERYKELKKKRPTKKRTKRKNVIDKQLYPDGRDFK